MIVEEVEDVGNVDEVEPGVVAVVVDEAVRLVEVVVVGDPEVGELAPTRNPTLSAPSANGMSTNRPNLDGNDAFTFLIYIVASTRRGEFVAQCYQFVT